MYDSKQQIGPLSKYHVGNLLELHFRGTAVQDTDLRHVSVLDPENLIDLTDTDITDNGLSHLYGLRVKKIVLTGTKTSSEGITRLKNRLGSLAIVEY